MTASAADMRCACLSACRYVTRKDLAQPALFGAGAGCDLAMDTCQAYVAKTPGQNLYCPADKKDGARARWLVLRAGVGPMHMLSCHMLTACHSAVHARCTAQLISAPLTSGASACASRASTRAACCQAPACCAA